MPFAGYRLRLSPESSLGLIRAAADWVDYTSCVPGRRTARVGAATDGFKAASLLLWSQGARIRAATDRFETAPGRCPKVRQKPEPFGPMQAASYRCGKSGRRSDEAEDEE